MGGLRRARSVCVSLSAFSLLLFLYGVSSQVIRRLQMVLNAAARLVVGVGKYEHITPALRDVLHWLPVPQQIQFKIAISAFDCVCEHSMPTLTMSAFGVSGRGHIFVRLNAMTCFSLRQEHSLVGGVSMLQPAAIWNALPPHLRLPSNSRGQFRAGLKTHLFTQVYGHL